MPPSFVSCLPASRVSLLHCTVTGQQAYSRAPAPHLRVEASVSCSAWDRTCSTRQWTLIFVGSPLQQWVETDCDVTPSLTSEECWEMCFGRVGQEEHLKGQSGLVGGAQSGKFEEWDREKRKRWWQAAARVKVVSRGTHGLATECEWELSVRTGSPELTIIWPPHPCFFKGRKIFGLT